MKSFVLPLLCAACAFALVVYVLLAPPAVGGVQAPCFVFEDARVPYNPLSVRITSRGLGAPVFDGPIFADADLALEFARDSRLVLCAVEPEPFDAGMPDAGVPLFFRSMVVLPDGGLRYERVWAQ